MFRLLEGLLRKASEGADEAGTEQVNEINIAQQKAYEEEMERRQAEENAHVLEEEARDAFYSIMQEEYAIDFARSEAMFAENCALMECCNTMDILNNM
jgi:Skp family chaperone for outer membrane proteins